MNTNIAPMTKVLSLSQQRGQDTILAKFVSAVENKNFELKGDILTTTLQELTPFVKDTLVSQIEVNIVVHYDRSFISHDCISRVPRFPTLREPTDLKPFSDKTVQPPGYKLFQNLPLEPFLSWQNSKP